MKKTISVIIVFFVIASGLLACREDKTEEKPSQKPLSITERKAKEQAERKKWEASPDGVKFKAWQASPEGKKIHANHNKIKKHLTSFTDMQAVVTSTTFKRENAKPSGPKWLIVKIDDEEYMMQFLPKDFEPLKTLKVGDKIIVKSRSASYSPNHPYLILSSDYIAQNNKVIFKRDFNENKGC